MTSPTWEQLLAADTRLRRRVSLTNLSQRDLLALTRNALGASKLEMVSEEESPLTAISDELLTKHGLTRDAGNVKTSAWHPDWLESGRFPVGDASARRQQRQQVRSVEADEFYTRTLGRSSYRTVGQRLASRCAVSAGSGDVLTCVLPTGSGKTDVFLLRALQLRPRQTIIIVPTVSLALDLERRIGEITKSREPFAYHGTLSEGEKADFRRRISSGEQWLTVTSPEAACSSLAKGLEQAATGGRLGLLVIDEAHIVAEWGDDFRLEFQTLASLRRRLEEVAPAGRAPTTMLFTGTLDQHGYQSLRRLFPGRSEVLVSDQSTRPEPEWWSAKCEDEETKRVRLLEAVAHLPRPLLIYTSLHTSQRSTTVNHLYDWLSSAGYRTVRRVAGSTSSKERTGAVTGLRMSSPDAADDLDIVIATSAFGMGVDIDDIRAVIHVCLPESVNRLYQEVGRAGRDGKATTSLVLWTDTDLEVAKGLAEARQIGGATAWIRWERLRIGRVVDQRLTIDLTTPHEGVTYPFSDANRYWNMQTLLGMQRAGMIQIQWPEPPSVPMDVNDDQLAEAFSKYSNQINVSVLQGDLDKARFIERFQRERSEVVSIGNASYGSAFEIVETPDGEGQSWCLNRRLSAHYRFVDRFGGIVPVGIDCGGCPHCRESAKTSRLPRQSPYSSGRFPPARLGLDDLLRDRNICCIVKDPWDPEIEEAFFRRLTTRRTLRIVGIKSVMGIGRFFDASAIVWWESSDQFASGETDPADVLTVVLVDDIDKEDKLVIALNKLGQLSHGIVYTSPQRTSPFDQRFLLHESYPLVWNLKSALRCL